MSVAFTAASSMALNLGLNLNLLNNVQSATMTAWVKRSGLPSGGNFYRAFCVSIGPPPGTAPQPRLALCVSSTGTIRTLARAIDTDSGGNIIGTTVIADQTWAHVVCTFNYATTIGSIYINGALDITQSTIGTTAGNTSATNAKCAAIGALPDITSGQFYNGSLEDVRIYNRLLTASEAKTMFAARGKDGIWNGCQLRCPLNELSPGNLVVSAVDLSASRLSATPSGAPVYDTGIVVPKRRNVHFPSGIIQ